jgi:hypothetical protein
MNCGSYERAHCSLALNNSYRKQHVAMLECRDFHPRQHLSIEYLPRSSQILSAIGQSPARYLLRFGGRTTNRKRYRKNHSARQFARFRDHRILVKLPSAIVCHAPDSMDRAYTAQQQNRYTRNIC